jgi:hypothetical protein
MSKENKLTLIGLAVFVMVALMIFSPLETAIATSSGDDGGGSGDDGGGSGDDGGGDNGGDKGNEDKQESNDEPKEESKSQDEPVNDEPKQETNENELGNPDQEAINNEGAGTTGLQQEPIKDKVQDDPNEYCDTSKNCVGPGVTPGSEKNCVGKYCYGDEPKPNTIIGDTISRGPIHIDKVPNDCKNENFNDKCDWQEQGDDCKDKSKWNKDKCGGNDWDDWNKNCNKDHNKWNKDKCKDHDHDGNDNHNHRHNHNNDKHYYNKDTNIYYYYYTNDYNDNHATVILQPDYSHTNNYHDIRIVIGFDFDTIVNFAGKPEDFVVTGLNINEGEQFNVCMKNENDGKTNCVTATLKDEDKAVYVDIRVP